MKYGINKLADNYTKRIILNCVGDDGEDRGLAYWQNRLFASIMIYLLPLSLLAIIPGIIMSILGGAIFLAVFDSLIIFLLAFITFNSTLSVTIRKSIFIFVIYMSAVILLYFLGSYGPGLLYLMSVTVFSALIFKKSIAYLSVAINILICFFFGIAIYFNKLSAPILTQHSIGSWVAVTSNLILLSLIITALLPTILKGLQRTIEEDERLRMLLHMEQRKLEKTLSTVNIKNKELEEFAYMTSHDLQEPLRAVGGFLRRLEKNHKSQLDDQAQHYVYMAKDGAERMKKTIADLLEYSITGKKTNTIEPINTNAVLEGYVKQNQELLTEKNAGLLWNDLPVIEADRTSIGQLFQNLISNALKYQKKGEKPAIFITHQETKKYWQFAFSDNGIGIRKSDLDKVFIVFRRLHDKSEYPGSGIGLAICKKIVENHKGQIWVESEPGKGSTFYFTISKNLN